MPARLGQQHVTTRKFPMRYEETGAQLFGHWFAPLARNTYPTPPLALMLTKFVKLYAYC